MALETDQDLARLFLDESLSPTEKLQTLRQDTGGEPDYENVSAQLPDNYLERGALPEAEPAGTDLSALEARIRSVGEPPAAAIAHDAPEDPLGGLPAPGQPDQPPAAHFEQPREYPQAPREDAQLPGAVDSRAVRLKGGPGGPGGAQARRPRYYTTGSDTFVDRARQIQEAPKGDPELMKSQAERASAMIDLAADEYDATREAEGRLAIAQGNLEADRAEMRKDFEEKQRARREAMAAKVAAYEKMAGEVASQEIDTARYYKNQTTGQRIGGMIGIALGTMGKALNPNVENVTLDRMKQAVKDDIAAQVQDAKTRKDGLAAQGSLLRMAQSVHEDEELQQLASYQAGLEGVTREYQGHIARITEPARRAAAERQMLALQSEIGETALARQRKEQDLVTRQQTFSPKRRVLAGPRPMTAKQLAEQLKLRDLQQQAQAGGSKFYVPPMSGAIGGYARTEKEASDLRGSQANFSTSMRLLDRVINLSGQAGTKLVGDKAKEAKSITNQLYLNLKNQEQLGALDKGALDVAKDIVGDATSFSPGTQHALKEYKQRIVRQHNDRLKARIIDAPQGPQSFKRH